ncbi:hypothetical protein Cal7507_5706 [Calothrix sp. PCC 7507]|nr:hypothetical protein Cal7507_5706 [Calothrix sp. PCC 7507]
MKYTQSLTQYFVFYISYTYYIFESIDSLLTDSVPQHNKLAETRSNENDLPLYLFVNSDLDAFIWIVLT